MSNITGVTQSNAPIYVNGNEQPEQSQQQNAPVLKNGSTIQGTVVSVTEGEDGKTALINIGDDMINAKLSSEMGLREGQFLNFMVRGQGNGTVSITPLYENTSVDQSTMKALMAAGIEINNDTVQMVKEMMSASLPIDKNSLLEMNKNLSAYPNASISILVEMKSLNIPITDNNLAQYNSYKNYEHQVIGEMQNIMDEIPEAFNELIAAGDDKGAVNLYGNVLKLFTEGVETAAEQIPGEVSQTQAEAGQVQGETGQVHGETEQIQGQTPKAGDALATETLAKDDSSPLVKDASNEQTVRYNYKLEGFDNTLRNLGVSEKTINNIMNSAKEGITLKDQSALLKELSTLFEEADLSSPVETAAWKKLFSDDTYNKMLKDNIESQWLLKPTDVEKKENIENLYQRLGNQAKALAETMNNTLGAEAKLSQSANNLSNNLGFMNQINQMFQYVQLPLQMTGQNVHGDLYVYKNKNKKMSEDGSVSAILHLDMENLGPVDVYVKMIDTKVTTNFYVADESALDLINDNIYILNDRLEKRGYSLTVKMSLQDEIDGEDAAVDEMLNVMKTPVLSTASFDARA
ncbi:flagellar hook-length control protein FliK [Butyrivibrio sp. MC2021]|uniref:flagellar hook-length control protein FliK n=1 Tax=Butyrivibrio sp. MC2021 TaxID=1408306 RepID=UPI00047977C4|nr:flagellar hook-length control protein FliK [Butyrivibrio sp. MC2021]